MDTGKLKHGKFSGSAMPQLVYQQDPIRNSVRSLGARWTLLIVRDIGFLKLSRFGEILRNNPGLTARVLSKRLKDMQKEGLIERKATKDVITYSLTPRGEDAVFILLAFLRYGLKHHTGEKLGPSAPLPSFDVMIKQYQQLPVAKSSRKHQN
jgi:DNA-binding HxlR family transcriptional regulator